MKVAVLGAGVMGAAIAAHCANVGIKTLLLDILPTALNEEEMRLGLTLSDSRVRNRFAQQGLNRLSKERPSPIYSPEVLSNIEIGNMTDHLSRLAEVDWIIEVVVEQLPIKQQLFAQIEQYWQPGTIVSSNTSGISLHEMVRERTAAFRAHFLGTHFFNPPRYMKLLELIPTEWTKKKVVNQVQDWAEERLGKGVVICKDTPNFIANRIGTYGIQVTLQAMERFALRFDAVDAITGRLMGRPKSATFRTLDLVGLDTYCHVVRNVLDRSSDEEDQSVFQLSSSIDQLVQKGWLGQKSGQGFYLKDGSGIKVLDTTSFQYVKRENYITPAMMQAKQIGSLPKRLQLLLFADDPAGKFAWEITKKILLYSARQISDIADHPLQIDQAMRWGFHWELGPFEVWEALGVEKVAERMKQEGDKLPAWIESLLRKEHPSFYPQVEGSIKIAHPSGALIDYPIHDKAIPLKNWRKSSHVITQNQGGTLLDLGDGIACLDFHAPKGAIGPDFINILQRSIDEVDRRFRGLVIGSVAPHFCVGANLMLMLLEAQEQNWDEIEGIIRSFQQTLASIRTVEKPVVVAPYGRTLGGGVELCLPADQVQASTETYMGLVETAVGLIPAGGGCKEMLVRMTKNAKHPVARQEAVNQLFQQIALATVSTSAEEARRLGYLRSIDRTTIRNDQLLFDAKQQVTALAETGYRASSIGKLAVVGNTGYSTLKMAIYDFQLAGKLTDHDVTIAEKLAYVLAGGDLPEGTEVTEEYLLDLEREAFLHLIDQPKTQARMQYMLRTGKPLRN
ncbi:3-hydroxyacyl-CoA dehydrogenase [Seinonella peptonophila]|uniref:3-hydroxyacyl-CoA dehydrogenase n=1 Tax=Seinonella peptonophila TaxID=112248 RepID=A0A1M4Z3T2_9BACL|nr:3-hydroxyacyl-CoA dehydrogenase/enoyl-CoA hydratase family protein [Seinonella peptonophila]SHF12608.1 3-hydroxyacyl-CoA dehydrogenase [Seinonella peptonophila]